MTLFEEILFEEESNSRFLDAAFNDDGDICDIVSKDYSLYEDINTDDIEITLENIDYEGYEEENEYDF